MTEAKRHICLIANPAAGGNARGTIERARDFLRGRGHRVDLQLTSARGDARRGGEQAREKDYDLIIAAGGDGTLNEVINGLVPSRTPLAFIPLGTTNVFALEVGIPFDIEQACRIALEGQVRPVCLGLAGETRFLLMAGIGFDAETVFRVSTRLKRWAGKFAYLASALAVLAKRPFAPLEVQTEEGRILRGYNLVIGNARLYGGRFTLTPQASLFEDSLEVCLFLQPGRLRFLGSVFKLVVGRALSEAEALVFKARQFEVRGAELPVQIDGDFHGRLPMRFRAVPGELTMVFPESS